MHTYKRITEMTGPCLACVCDEGLSSDEVRSWRQRASTPDAWQHKIMAIISNVNECINIILLFSSKGRSVYHWFKPSYWKVCIRMAPKLEIHIVNTVKCHWCRLIRSTIYSLFLQLKAAAAAAPLSVQACRQADRAVNVQRPFNNRLGVRFDWQPAV